MLAQCLSWSWAGFLAPHAENFPSSQGQQPRPTPRPRGCAGPYCLDRHCGSQQKRRSKKGRAVLPPTI